MEMVTCTPSLERCRRTHQLLGRYVEPSFKIYSVGASQSKAGVPIYILIAVHRVVQSSSVLYNTETAYS